MRRASLFTILSAILFAACGDVPVVEIQTVADSALGVEQLQVTVSSVDNAEVLIDKLLPDSPAGALEFPISIEAKLRKASPGAVVAVQVDGLRQGTVVGRSRREITLALKQTVVLTLLAPGCGDGVIDANEQCDDGTENKLSGPCLPSCTPARCGDGIFQANLGEECDDGNTSSQDGCDTNCKVEAPPGCGDGFAQFPEECDDGAANSNTDPNACRTNCVRPRCGDGVTDDSSPFNEQCDDADLNNLNGPCLPDCTPARCGDGIVQTSLLEECDGTTNCDAQCKIIPPPSCGDGNQDPNEQCDNGPLNSNATPDACRTDCRLPICGDGVIDSTETCDDAGANSLNGPCLPDCSLARCGDGVFQSARGEQCDDANQIPLDGCENDCTVTIPPSCGDGNLDFNEQCDNGPLNSNTTPNACRIDCTVARCGDGAIDLGETCDNGGANSLAGPCLPTCQNAACGDGILQTNRGEACDDGNITPGDGCDAACAFEVLVGCGNGTIEGNEECDNGAANSNINPDACRRNCTLPRCGDGATDTNEECDNAGANSLAGPCLQTCELAGCGDQIMQVNRGEQCDDGNIVPGDGCDASCLIEPAPGCGDGVSDPLLGEQCDNGNANSNSLANACRTNCLTAHCGDGVTDNTEQCDDGASLNSVAGPCLPSCQVARCGDGVLQVNRGEQCDDGNNINGDNCSATCAIEPPPVCGDGILQVNRGEECDNGNANSNSNPNACRTNCLNPRCGDGVADTGEQCDNGAGNALAGPCLPICQNARCGDGVFQPNLGEQCDDGNTTNNDTCSNTCQVVAPPNCGDGVLTGAEQCDNGAANSNSNPNACRLTCTAARCGDGVVDSGETCDNGGANNLNGPCLPTCQNARCGDGVFQPSRGEECDDGNTTAGDGCNATCLAEAAPGCGDNIVSGNEQCDNGAANSDSNPNACRLTCTNPRCGDGVIDTGETCDDGGANSLSGPCLLSCQPARCGDGIFQLNLGEQCDDGNLDELDGCDNACHFSLIAGCGDGVLSGNEQCDNGFGVNSNVLPDACRTNCTDPRCGDGVADTGEQCDEGGANSFNGPCLLTCELARCGDGIRQQNLGEECDDGNTLSGDGCASNCTAENPPNCGDGLVQTAQGEQCDDGNFTSGDGCDNTCHRERCGDGTLHINLGEDCDDGNSFDNDGCSAVCQIEFCGDSILQTNEECDFGDFINGDGCSAGCLSEVCGNGRIDFGEECDDNNAADNDGCDSTCAIEFDFFCANTIPAVASNPGNTVNGDSAFNGSCVGFGGKEVIYSLTPGTTGQTGTLTLTLQSTTDQGVYVRSDCLTSGSELGCSNFAPLGQDEQLVLGVEGGVPLSIFVDANQGQEGPYTLLVSFVPDICGDNQLTGAEECEDGNLTVGDGCDAQCTLERCGDGTVRTTNGASRLEFIWLASSCTGNSNITFSLNGQTALQTVGSSSCSCNPGIRTASTTDPIVLSRIQDGNNNFAVNFPGLGHDLAWAIAVVHGVTDQEIVIFDQSGGQDAENRFSNLCSAGSISNGTEQSTTATVSAGEQCDDGNTIPGDGCSEGCGLEVCGNDHLDTNEQCDDGNTNNNDGCNSGCTFEFCSDGVVQTSLTANSVEFVWLVNDCDNNNQPQDITFEINDQPALVTRGDFGNGCTCFPGVRRATITDPTILSLLTSGDNSFSVSYPGSNHILSWAKAIVNAGVQQEVVIFDQTGGVNATNEIQNRCNSALSDAPEQAINTDILLGEECDDSNGIAGDGCSPTCTFEICGNGILDINEECDDNNATSNDGCSAACDNEFCGDGVVSTASAATAIDLSFMVDDCDGNGTAEPLLFTINGQQVASIPRSPGSGCTCTPAVQTLTFTSPAVLGQLKNGLSDLTVNYQGNGNRGLAWAVATIHQGDGQTIRKIIFDQSPISADACLANPVTTNPACDRCSQGMLFNPAPQTAAINANTSEACDPPGVNCNAVCQVPACGNGFIDAGEECDDGCGNDGCSSADNGDGCSSTCLIEFCGPGTGGATTTFLDPATGHCYLGYNTGLTWQNARDFCNNLNLPGAAFQGTQKHLATIQNTSENAIVRSLTAFGNSLWIGLNDLTNEAFSNRNLFVWEDGEPNLFNNFASGEPNNSGDEDCVHFLGNQSVWNDLNCGNALFFACEVERATCNNGILEETEECEDGNLANNDGCSSTCKIERCGDGVAQPGEVCDDGNTINNDSCDNACKTPACGNGFVDSGESVFVDLPNTLAKFEFEGNTNDTSGNNRNAALIGGSFVPGQFGTALQITSGQAHGFDWSNFSSTLVHPFSIELVLTPQDTSNFTRILRVANSNLGWYYTNQGFRDFANQTVGQGAMLANQLHYIAVVSTSATTANVFFQGALVGSVTLDSTFTNPPLQALFFRDDSTFEQLGATIEGVRVSSVARTSSEIALQQQVLARGGSGAELCDDGNQASNDGCNSTCTAIEICGDGATSSGPTVTSVDLAFMVDDCDGNGTAEPLLFTINGQQVASIPRSPGSGCTCTPAVQTLTLTDPNVLALFKNGVNDLTVNYQGNGNRGLAWAIATVRKSDNTTLKKVIFDQAPSDAETCLANPVTSNPACNRCNQGMLFNPPPQTAPYELTLKEFCDDSNLASGDGCSASCRTEGTCGNAIVEAGETCDDGNAIANDGCSASCAIEACGDGVNQDGVTLSSIEYFWLGRGCGGNETTTFQINGVTSFTQIQGDGSCDCNAGVMNSLITDPNILALVKNQQNTFTVQMSPSNSRLSWAVAVLKFSDNSTQRHVIFDQPGGTNDDPNNCLNGVNTATSCNVCNSGELNSTTAQTSTFKKAIDETCDDGNIVGGDGCSATCKSEACGNGILDPTEACDDKNTVSDDGCTATCNADEVCGDSSVDPNTAASLIEFNWLATGCSGQEDITFRINDQVALFKANIDNNCTCTPGVQTFAVTDPTVLALLRPGLNNFSVQVDGADPRLSWAEASIRFGGAGGTIKRVSIFDTQGGTGSDAFNCLDGINTGTSCNLCNAGQQTGNATEQRAAKTRLVDLATAEQCDDGNTTNGDGCSSSCLSENLCGNNTVNAGLTLTKVEYVWLGTGCGANQEGITFTVNGVTSFAINNNEGACTCTPGVQNYVITDPNVLALFKSGRNTLTAQVSGSDPRLSWAVARLTFSDGATQNVTIFDEPIAGNGNDGVDCINGTNTATSCNLCNAGQLTGNLAQQTAVKTTSVVLPIAETCDGGNTTAGDGCSATCKSEACGNGILDPTEACDDKNTGDGDGCTATCNADEVCGDSSVDPNLVATSIDFFWLGTGCSGQESINFTINGQPALSLANVDGTCSGTPGVQTFTVTNPAVMALLHPGANTFTVQVTGADPRLSWALATVRFGGAGGTSKQITIFDQTGGTGNDAVNCLAGVTVATSCNLTNSVQAFGSAPHSVTIGVPLAESCDDGNTVSGDACQATCVNNGCGNGFVDAGEQCDDGNTTANDGCSVACQNEVCGDGATQAEPAITSVDFIWNARTTSGAVNPITFRINGSLALSTIGNGGNSSCTPGIQTISITDPAVLKLIKNGSNTFTVQHTGTDPQLAWAVAVIRRGAATQEVVIFDSTGGSAGGNAGFDAEERDPNVCNAGATTDGLAKSATVSVLQTETCDDGNLVAGDACGPTCVTPACGNGFVDTGEQCDDGNTAANDGCSASCQSETCGNNTFEPARGATAIDFTWLARSCSGAANITFKVNGQTALVTLGESGTCQCDPGVKTVTVKDPSVLALLLDGQNTFTVEFPGANSRLAWATATVRAASTQEFVIFDANDGGDAQARRTNLCAGNGTAQELVNPGAQSATGFVNLQEQCDPPNGTTCDATCRTSSCGNNHVETTEQCDDGNTSSQDGCSSTCREETCGDGVLNVVNGSTINSVDFVWLARSCNGPNNNIAFTINGQPAFSGVGEVGTCSCTPGIQTATVTNPAILSLIGDGLNTFAVDFTGANNDRRLGWAVAVVHGISNQEVVIFDQNGGGDAQARANNICNAGEVLNGPAQTKVANIISAEECDPPGAGCNALCQVPACGNGFVDAGEECDDGCAGDGCSSADNGDGCSSTCFIEFCNPNFGTNGANSVTLDPATGHCFLGFNGGQTYASAQTTCNALARPTSNVAAHLATIHNTAENTIVRAATPVGNNTWIGLNDITTEANTDPAFFVWDDNEANNFANFSANQPDNSSNEDCTHFQSNLNTWNDVACTNSFSFVCELEVVTCGNGVFEANEECEDGNVINGDGCSSSCRIESCGDNAASIGGNLTAIDFSWLGTGCNGQESINFFIGSDLVLNRENVDGACSCTPGIQTVTITDPAILAKAKNGRNTLSVQVTGNDPRLAWAAAVFKTTAGNKRVTIFDERGGNDAENQNTNLCTAGQGLGNASRSRVVAVNLAEQCDDGGTAAGGGCGPTCLTEVCGNSLVDPGETCDDGKQCTNGANCTLDAQCAGIGDNLCLPRSGDGCNNACTASDSCGDGTVNTGGPTLTSLEYIWLGRGCNNLESINFTINGTTSFALNNVEGTCSATPGLQRYLIKDPNVLALVKNGNNTFTTQVTGGGATDPRLSWAVAAMNFSDGFQQEVVIFDSGGGNDAQNRIANITTAGETTGNTAKSTTAAISVKEDCDGGASCSTSCHSQVCGNGILDPTEACDDKNTITDDGCTNTCNADEICGDSSTDRAKVATSVDFFYLVTGCGGSMNVSFSINNGLVASLQNVDATCAGTTGVNVVTITDPGSLGLLQAGANNIAITVTGTGTAGDPRLAWALARVHFGGAGGTVQDVTIFDQTGGTGNDAVNCLAGVNVATSCNLVNAGQLQPGAAGATRSVTANLSLNETCDDGNTTNGDGCSAVCGLESVTCGNGIVQSGETCDDGNNIAGDGCSATCLVESCGDTVVQSGAPEVTALDYVWLSRGCSGFQHIEFTINGSRSLFVRDVDNTCSDTPGIRVATIDPNGMIKNGNNNFTVQVTGQSGSTPRIAWAVAVLRYSDGSTQEVTIFDQGGGLDAEQRNFSISSSGELSSTAVQTKAQVLLVREDCEDTGAGDGCNANCRFEGCRNGVVEGTEECDDSNAVAGDGCSPTCTVDFCFPDTSTGLADTTFLNPANGHCYTGYNNTRTWQNAQAFCATLNRPAAGVSAHLVTIQNTAENNVARGVIPFANEAWIGTNDITVEDITDTQRGDDFVWENGEPFTFNGFAANQPDDGSSNEDCAHFFGNQSGWNDANCAGARFFICEIEKKTCGNGVFETGEQCDDGNTAGGDGCSSTCQFETCGDGLVLSSPDLVALDYAWLGLGCGSTPDTISFSINGTTAFTNNNNGCDCDTGVSRYTITEPQLLGLVKNGANDFSVSIAGPDSRVAWATVTAQFSNNTSKRFVIFDQLGGTGNDPNDCLNGVSTGTSCNVCNAGQLQPGAAGATRSSSFVVTAAEACDDGNTAGNDGCSALCNQEVCGNGILDGTEACDDGNTTNGDGCPSNCAADEICGDASLDTNKGATSIDFHWLGTGCGEGQNESINFTINGQPALSLANVDSSCTCDPLVLTATITDPAALALLHDGNNEFGVQVTGPDPRLSWAVATVHFGGVGGTTQRFTIFDQSGGTGNDGINCLNGVNVNTSCNLCNAGQATGNLAVQTAPKLTTANFDVTEQCDDGNLVAGDGCNGICHLETCGNGVLDAGEQCDDAKHCSDGVDCTTNSQCLGIGDQQCLPRNNDGCSDTCDFEICGDGVLQPVSNGAQSVTFTWLATSCGGAQNITFRINGQIAVVTQGDNGSCSCSPGIRTVTVTDPAIVSLLNQPQNNVTVQFVGGGDPELAWAVATINGVQSADVTLFDANGGNNAENRTTNLCSAGVTTDGLQHGANTGPVQIEEECDDGNNTPGDGCTQACKIEECGNAIVDVGEDCDDGNTVDGDLCRNNCTTHRCGDNVFEPNIGAKSVEFIWLADSCSLPLNINFKINGQLALDAQGAGGACSCTPGVRKALVTDPAVLALVQNGQNVFAVDFPNSPLSSANLAWAVAIVHSTIDQEVVIFDAFGGNDAQERDPNRCNAGSLSNAFNQNTTTSLITIEECEDGNLISGDGCDSSCRAEVCGNGRIENAEECDDGNTVGNDGCGPACESERCGDGVLQPTSNGAQSVTFKWLATSCGGAQNITFRFNNQIALVTQGDNGSCSCSPGIRTASVTDTAILNLLNQPQNSITVQFAGGGDPELAWATATINGTTTQNIILFDANGGNNAQNQTTNLCSAGVTTDGLQHGANAGPVQIEEDCDDGNVINGDGCSSICSIEECGNNKIDFNEICDDGKQCTNGSDCALDADCVGIGDGLCLPRAGDGCSDICLDEICGDGVTQTDEQCDDGGTVSGDGCSATCVLEVCGNGILDPNEACDDGNTTFSDGCSDTCTVEFCGDGIIQPDLVPLTTFEGIAQNIAIDGLTGWSPCYTDLYNNSSTPLSQILAQCSGEQLMLACRPVGSNTLTLAAHAPRTDVTFVTNDNTPHNANGVGWYFNNSRSWGFAPQGLPLSLSSCDTQDMPGFGGGSGGAQRMCWHTGGGNINSGFRCGQTNLNGSSAFERVVFQSDLFANSGGETCDDGNNISGDGCNAGCGLEICGNGQIDINEACDNGKQCTDGTSCTTDTDCTGIGDGLCAPRSGDGCDDTCGLEFCGDNILQPGIPAQSIDFVYLATGCSAPGPITFSLNGQTALVTQSDPNCSCSPGIDTVTVTDPNVLSLLQSGDNNFTVSFPKGNLSNADLAWAVAVIHTSTGPQEVVIFDQNGGNNAQNRSTDLCASGFETNGVPHSITATLTGIGEQCDDGNTVSGDGCSAACNTEICGDGDIDAVSGEQCDDGNLNSNDGCSDTCQLEFCGDGVLQVVEPIDSIDFAWLETSCPAVESATGSVNILFSINGDLALSAIANTDECNFCFPGVRTATITDPAVIALIQNGDNFFDVGFSDPSIVEFGWAVMTLHRASSDEEIVLFDANGGIDAQTRNPNLCTAGSAFNPGNATSSINLHLEEECDDGNNLDGDACSAVCRDEVCGNGFVDPTEDCDDGNLTAGDGCDAACISESVSLPYTENFDDNLAQGFLVVQGSQTSFWRVDGQRAQTPTKSLYFGDTANHTYADSINRVTGAALTPFFNVPATGATVSFQRFQATEGGVFFDELTVEVVDTFGAPLATLLTATQNTAGAFVLHNLNIPSTLAGQQVRLRFAFDTKDGFNNNFEGIYIDSLSIAP